MAVVTDCRMVMCLWYRTAEWSHGCGTGLQIVHEAQELDCRMVKWLMYWTAEW